MWKSFKAILSEVLFPSRCFLFKRYGCLLCGDCQSLLEISPIHKPDRTMESLDDIYAACSYGNHFAQKIIHGCKYDPFHKKLGPVLATIIDCHFQLLGKKCEWPDAIATFVPLSTKRMRWRGFNQAQEIANGIGQIWHLPVYECLRKNKETKVQAELSSVDRRANIKKAFSINNDLSVKDKTVLLIDDVITTGATVQECAKVLRHNGAKSVIAIAVART